MEGQKLCKALVFSIYPMKCETFTLLSKLTFSEPTNIMKIIQVTSSLSKAVETKGIIRNSSVQNNQEQQCAAELKEICIFGEKTRHLYLIVSPLGAESEKYGAK